MNQIIGCLILLIILGLLLTILFSDDYNLFHFTVVLLLAMNVVRVEGDT